MTSAAMRALLVSAALALGACAVLQPPAPTGPSPRPDCAEARVTVYFADEVASDQPVVMPLLDSLMSQVHACETAGGALRSITIEATADPNQSRRDADGQIRRRQERVRDALVRLGAPAAKIHFAPGGRVHPEAVMARRADITADMY